MFKWRQYNGALPALLSKTNFILSFRLTSSCFLNKIWSRLRQAGLETQRIYAVDKRKVMIKIRCPPDRLMDVAEVLRLKLKTRDGKHVRAMLEMISFVKGIYWR